MHVQEIERLGLKDLEHFGGERQRVGRVIEERVGSDFHFVEMDVRVVGVHADRRGVADEVDVVAAGGQFGAEFSGDHAGAAVGWVAGYPDAHKLAGLLSLSGFNDTLVVVRCSGRSVRRSLVQERDIAFWLLCCVFGTVRA